MSPVSATTSECCLRESRWESMRELSLTNPHSTSGMRRVLFPFRGRVVVEGSRLVRTNYTVRTGAFAYSYLAVGLHLFQQDYGVAAWALFTLQFLAYPHLAYWRAMRSDHPTRAELDNLYVDSLLLGAWVGYLGFPTWVGYGLLASTTLNATVNRG